MYSAQLPKAFVPRSKQLILRIHTPWIWRTSPILDFVANANTFASKYLTLLEAESVVLSGWFKLCISRPDGGMKIAGDVVMAAGCQRRCWSAIITTTCPEDLTNIAPVVTPRNSFQSMRWSSQIRYPGHEIRLNKCYFTYINISYAFPTLYESNPLRETMRIQFPRIL